MHRIFVYGTLKQGFGNHDRIFGGFDIKIQPAFTYGRLYDLGWYPAMLERSGNPDLSRTEGTDKVFGELIEFDNPEILQKVDYLEGFKGENHPLNYYERRDVDVFVGDDMVKSWVYLLSEKQVKRYGGNRLNTGVWMNS